MKKTLLKLLIFLSLILSFTGISYAARKTIYIKGKTTTYQTPSNYGTLGGPGEATSTSGLVGYWPFDGKYMTWSSATVGTSTDASGNGNNGTLVSMNRGTSVAAGEIGQSLIFNGTNQYILLPSGLGTSLSSRSAVTISMWVKEKAIPIQFARVFGDYTGNTCDLSLSFNGHAGNGNNEVDLAIFGTGGTGNQYVYTTGTNVVSVGVWTLITGVYNGSLSGNAKAAVYINGSFVSSNGAGGTIPATTCSSLPQPTIATYEPAGGNYYFNGAVDDVRLYNRALSATEINQLYQLGSTTIIK